MKYEIETHPKIIEFANQYKFPGWYFDVNGCYGCLLGKYWICVFVSDLEDTLEITVDALSERGMFENNLEWEAPSDSDLLAETALRFMSKYAINNPFYFF